LDDPAEGADHDVGGPIRELVPALLLVLARQTFESGPDVRLQ
jgi:hypothetical protein